MPRSFTFSRLAVLLIIVHACICGDAGRLQNGGAIVKKRCARTGNQLAVIQWPDRKRLQLEVASQSRAELDKLEEEFGGRIKSLPRDWLKHSLRRKTKPIKVGRKRLVIPAGAAYGTGRSEERRV